MKSEKVEVNPERCLGFLLVCVCAAEGQKQKRSHIKIETPVIDESLYGSMSNGLATSSKFHG